MNEVTSNLASRWKRVGGVLIDGMISLVILVPIMLATGVLQRSFKGQKMTIGEQLGFAAAGWVLFLAINGYLLFHKGQTIGKLAVKTKIVDLDGNVPSFGKLLLLRYFILGVVAQIPFIQFMVGLVDAVFIFGKERRCLHDYMAGTRVVNA